MKDIGLWGDKIRRAYSDMGILGLADVDLGEIARQDEQVAQAFDARHVEVEALAREERALADGPR
jgi:hypothetical protein